MRFGLLLVILNRSKRAGPVEVANGSKSGNSPILDPHRIRQFGVTLSARPGNGHSRIIVPILRVLMSRVPHLFFVAKHPRQGTFYNTRHRRAPARHKRNGPTHLDRRHANTRGQRAVDHPFAKAT